MMVEGWFQVVFVFRCFGFLLEVVDLFQGGVEVLFLFGVVVMLYEMFVQKWIVESVLVRYQSWVDL